MVVNEVDFKRASKSVSDSFKIPWLYSIEALFKGEDVFASLPTRYGSDLQNSTDRCRWAVIFLGVNILKSSMASRFVDCTWEWLGWLGLHWLVRNSGRRFRVDNLLNSAIFTSWRALSFLLRWQFLQMYVESISTLHSIDNNSARTLKEKPLWQSKRFLFVFCTVLKVHTNELIVKSLTVVLTCWCGEIKIKANQNSLFQWCNDRWVITNQIIFHTFQEKSRGMEHDYQR